MAEEKISFQQTFNFNLLSTKQFTFQQDPKISRLLMKWSMLGRITTQACNFDQSFQSYRSHDFVWCGSWTLLGRDITHVNAEVVPCTKVSVDIFDLIYSNGILRPSGHIVKCYHEIYPDFDELRSLLLEEDSDNYQIISPSDCQEFLFRLFKHMVLGGELCQYEDVIDPYIGTANMMYKELVSVQKDLDTKEIGVVTTILKVSAYDHRGLCYPSAIENEQTFAHLCINPFKRHVYVLYHSFGIGDFSYT